jgi:hypothetical protein
VYQGFLKHKKYTRDTSSLSDRSKKDLFVLLVYNAPKLAADRINKQIKQSNFFKITSLEIPPI